MGRTLVESICNGRNRGIRGSAALRMLAPDLRYSVPMLSFICMVYGKLDKWREPTGSRVSGVTPQRSSHVTYDLPKVPTGSLARASMSTVSELIRGLCFRIRLPSELSSMMSRRRGKDGPAVVSPKAATMSRDKQGKCSGIGRCEVDYLLVLGL